MDIVESFSNITLLEIEENFDPISEQKFIEKHWYQSIYYSAFYFMIIYILKHYMKYKKPLALQRELFIWNIFQTITNGGGTFRCFYELTFIVSKFGFYVTLCDYQLWNQTKLFAFWMKMYRISKILDFIDTLFIVLRKRPLTFLHMIHHPLTLIFSWYFSSAEIALAPWLGFLNGFVHTFMYGYYALKAANLKIPRKVSIGLTVLQMMQLFSGFVLGSFVLVMKLLRSECNVTYFCCIFCCIVYGLYFVLFTNFFIQTYIVKKTKRS